MSNEVSELINEPREISISGKTLKIRQLKLKELFAFFEQKIKSERLADAQEMAKLMSGEEKNSFLVSIWKNLPTGEELSNCVIGKMSSVEGVVDLIFMACRDYQEGLTEEDIKDLIGLGDLDDLAPIITWISGSDNIDNKKKRAKK